MITRITLFKLREGETALSIAAQIEQTLAGLVGLASHGLSLPCDESSAKSWDLCLLMSFVSMSEHDRVLQSSELSRLLGRDLAAKVQVIKAWSFAELQK